jgi:hypothetical protein
MDLMTRSANAPIHKRLAEVAKELDDGTAVIDLALSEVRCYAEALRITREALAEALRQSGHTWEADPGRVNTRLGVSI